MGLVRARASPLIHSFIVQVPCSARVSVHCWIVFETCDRAQAGLGSAHATSKWPLPTPARSNPRRDSCGLDWSDHIMRLVNFLMGRDLYHLYGQQSWNLVHICPCMLPTGPRRDSYDYGLKWAVWVGPAGPRSNPVGVASLVKFCSRRLLWAGSLSGQDHHSGGVLFRILKGEENRNTVNILGLSKLIKVYQS